MTRTPAPQASDRRCWCDATGGELLFRAGCPGGPTFQVQRCPGCGVMRLEPQPSDALLLSYYDPAYYGPSPAKFVEPIASLVRYCQAGRARLVRRHVPPPARVLDIGCGNGNVLAQLRQMGYEAHGTELTPKSAPRIPADAGITVHVGDILDLDLSEESFDAITLWHVFEHLRKPFETAQKLCRLLKKEGWLIMSMPNAQSPEAAIFRDDWFHLDVPRHLHGFGPDSLRTLMRAAELEAAWLRTWSFEQNPYGFMQSALNAAGFPQNRAYDTLKHWRTSPRGSRWVDLAALAVMAGPGLVWSTTLSLAGRGATMTVGAQRQK